MEVETLFEGATPLALRLVAEGPWRSEQQMIDRAYRLLPELEEEEKIATLNAHPRIGEDPARLSRLSLAEQGSDSMPELDRLNAEYESRFGFRFVVFVDGRSKSEVVEVLKVRMERARDQELDEGLRAVVDIAASRVGR
ncbi:MAG TPA: 2-oxo-4-hydroxy-4-carboxy-5-ureidoimidazoline decarboxylase [Candidatus Dormibacteraeota bacterium]|nr:2-oxo-4-hydroxy-4-carboxy-5-ureidoimidazoline decarboxylase [Candidatus Dormibacteraeota bacterium]